MTNEELRACFDGDDFGAKGRGRLVRVRGMYLYMDGERVKGDGIDTGFDPNLFSNRLSVRDWQRNKHPHALAKPSYIRAVCAWFYL